MRRILLFLIVIVFHACTDLENTTYIYTMRNESGVSIKINFYRRSITENVISTTTFKNGEEITKKFRDWPPSTKYNFYNYFANNGFNDSIRVIYNNLKYKSFISEPLEPLCNGGDRNPLNVCVYSGTEETFIFTQEDYENAVDCDGNCE